VVRRNHVPRCTLGADTRDSLLVFRPKPVASCRTSARRSHRHRERPINVPISDCRVNAWHSLRSGRNTDTARDQGQLEPSRLSQVPATYAVFTACGLYSRRAASRRGGSGGGHRRSGKARGSRRHRRGVALCRQGSPLAPQDFLADRLVDFGAIERVDELVGGRHTGNLVRLGRASCRGLQGRAASRSLPAIGLALESRQVLLSRRYPRVRSSDGSARGSSAGGVHHHPRLWRCPAELYGKNIAGDKTLRK
jgi:hypothetical protein